MKKLLLIILLLTFALQGWAVTYYIGPGETYETLAAFHAAITPTDGDIIDGRGNTFNETVSLNGNGSIGKEITYNLYSGKNFN